MNTTKNLFLFLLIGTIATAMLTGCSKVKYKKTKGGMAYQLFPGKDTQQIHTGDFIKISITQKVRDSIYFTTDGGMPQYQQVNAQQSSYDISELWTSLHVGDSIVATQLIDTFIKRNPQAVPPQLKKGDKIMTYVKILAIYRTDSAARADFDMVTKNWLAGEIKTIEKYLGDKKITAEKTPSGAFVETLTPGTGNVADSGNYISVNYTGTSWSGKKFDSNMDTSFGHTEPLKFVVGSGQMMKGFDEAMKLLRVGTKARIYIPSSIAYGGNPQSPNIKPFENLIFDIEVLDIQLKAPPQPAQQPQNIDAPQVQQ